MAFALKVAKTKFLFTLPGALPVALAAAEKVGLPRQQIFLLEGAVAGFKTIHDLIALGRRHSGPHAPAYSIPAGRTNRDVCGYLNFSSGTTGLPKAVMLSHHNLIAQCLQLRQLQVREPGEPYSILAVTPLFHITGLVRYVHYPLCMNGRCIMLPGTFDFERMLRALITYRIREPILVPPIIIRLVHDKAVEPYVADLRRTIRTWSSGSAPIPPEITELLKKKFPESGFRQGYGATESTACISATPASHFDYRYASTGGKLVANTVAKVMALSGTPPRELGVGEVGEIWARGPQIAMGYLDNPAATAETFDTDGFFHTGDVGRIDAEGLVRIEDRIKEMIKVRGQQVAPAELEDCLLGHPRVVDVAVLGVPDAYSGEKPKAFAVVMGKKEGDAAETQGHEVQNKVALGRELLKWVQERKSRYKWLREIEFVDAVPKSPTGKLLRRVLAGEERRAGRVKGIWVRDDGSASDGTSPSSSATTAAGRKKDDGLPRARL